MNEQYHPKYAKKQKVRLPLGAYLSYLLIATLLITGISFSKFASTGGADDSARVALVMLDGGSDDTNTDLSLGNGVASAAYSFYITNNNASGQVSEVPLSYTIFVTMPDGQSLPTGVTVTLTYENTAYNPVSSENGVYTFDGGADFAAGVSAQHDYTLTFTVDETQISDDSTITGISISVKAEQID